MKLESKNLATEGRIKVKEIDQLESRKIINKWMVIWGVKNKDKDEVGSTDIQSKK